MHVVKNLLISQQHLTLLDKYHMKYDEWLGEKFSAFTVGRFFITPPWENSAQGTADIKIILHPGLVFGTGSHPTTRSCLQALEWVCHQERVYSVIDLGTGTGMLAIAAARLGCEKALAVDNNFLAAKTARNNVRLNRHDGQILVIRGSAKDWVDLPADLAIANMHYDVIKHLICSDGFFKKKWWIISGLLRSQAREVASRLSRYPIRIVKSWENDGIWHTFCLKLR
jgi:ribosomal protein L11 methyltransferase